MLPCTSTEMDGVLMTASTLMVEARTSWWGQYPRIWIKMMEKLFTQ